jgi:molybdate-binding protein
VELLRERRLIDEQIVVAGCDPSIFLAGEHLRRRLDKAGVVGIPMGSAAALDAVKRGEVHAAGLHVLDQRSGEWNLPYLRRHLAGKDATVVTFAAWEEGLMIQRGNPKRIRGVADLGRKDVAIVNREDGAGARFLLDRALKSAGLEPSKVRGYDQILTSHLDVARLIAQGQVDAGMGVRSAANICGLDFIPLQEERYDLVIPSPYFKSHPGVAIFLDILTSRPLRAEIEALGGYDTRETGKVRELTPARTA